MNFYFGIISILQELCPLNVEFLSFHCAILSYVLCLRLTVQSSRTVLRVIYVMVIVIISSLTVITFKRVTYWFVNIDGTFAGLVYIRFTSRLAWTHGGIQHSCQFFFGSH